MPATPPILLNLPNWERECRRAGLNTDGERARVLGVTRQTVCIVQGGHRAPSADFIAAALLAFPLARFEDLFTPRSRRHMRSVG